MKFKVEWCENKSPDWKIATLNDGSAMITEVSINRNDKKTGKVAFEKFDDIMPGFDVEGELWKSPAGKNYLFAPRPQSAPRTGGAGVGIKAAQERKAEMIEKAQDRKSESIAYFNSVNCAIELVSKMKSVELTRQETKEEIIHWRDWFLAEYRKYEASPETDKKNPF